MCILNVKACLKRVPILFVKVSVQKCLSLMLRLVWMVYILAAKLFSQVYVCNVQLLFGVSILCVTAFFQKCRSLMLRLFRRISILSDQAFSDVYIFESILNVKACLKGVYPFFVKAISEASIFFVKALFRSVTSC